MNDFLRRFRAAAPYLRRHRDATMVLCARAPGDDSTDSEATTARANFLQLLEDIAILTGLGARAVVAYETEEDGGESDKRPIDDDESARRQSAADNARRFIEARLSMGMPDTPMSGADSRVSCGNLISARPAGVVGGIDLRHRGRARRVAADEIRARLQSGNIVLLPPFGYSPSGESFYLGALEVATAAARALAAEKLIFFAPALAAGGGDNGAARQLTAHEARELAAMPARNSPLLREILARAAAACDDGVRRAHILNRDDPDSLLLELFSRDGVGTLISAAPFDQTRRARAEDAAAIFALTASEAGAALAPVDRARLESEIDNYRVVTRDGAILACAFARVYPAEKAVELGGLTVRADYRHQGKGDMLFRMIEAETRAAGMRNLFLLTTQAEHWFVERGFAATTDSILPADFPAERRSYCDPGRRSKILAKKLDA